MERGANHNYIVRTQPPPEAFKALIVQHPISHKPYAQVFCHPERSARPQAQPKDIKRAILRSG